MESEWAGNARDYAIKAHDGQLYGKEFPYKMHLQAVVSVLFRFGVETPLRIQVAWLHDTLEDTLATFEDLLTFFGTEVADVVARLTEPKGGNRRWRHDQCYPNITVNEDARIVKLADRIANVEAGGHLVGMYRKEHAEFKMILWRPAVASETELAMWMHLDSLLIKV